MSQNNNILDAFDKKASLEQNRKYYYLLAFVSICVLVWGAAGLHWLGYIDMVPLLEPPEGWIALALLYTILLLPFRWLGLRWLIAAVSTAAIFIFNGGLIIGLVTLLQMDSQTLPFEMEMIRLSIMSVGYGLLYILIVELIYRFILKE